MAHGGLYSLLEKEKKNHIPTGLYVLSTVIPASNKLHTQFAVNAQHSVVHASNFFRSCRRSRTVSSPLLQLRSEDRVTYNLIVSSQRRESELPTMFYEIR